MTRKRLKGKIYAEDLPYWKSSKRTAETWLELTVDLLKKYKGTRILAHSLVTLERESLVLIDFIMDGDMYKIRWPAMESFTENAKAAKVQAVTMVYHDIKAKLVAAAVQGPRSAFLNYFVLEDGTPAGMATSSQLQANMPRPLALPEKAGS